jgi:CheY-like chemotaxis protein
VHPKRILVADDDSKFLGIVTEYLAGAGYDVRAETNPANVLEMAAALAPDLVILDISMPGKDGFQVARELRSNPRTRGIRCMFITGHRDSTNVKKAKDSGGVAYLEKPFKSSSLIWMVKTLLANREPDAGSEPGLPEPQGP